MHRMTWFSVLGFSALALAACGSSTGGGTTKGSGGSAGSTSSTGGKSSSSTGGKSTSGPGGSGGGTTTGPGGSTTSAMGGSGGSTTSATGGSATGAGGSSTGCSGSTPVTLTVLNFDAWCSVAVGTGTASPAASQTVCVADGSVTLTATPNAGFILGDWYGIDGNTTTGQAGTVTGSGATAQTTITTTVSGSSACVSICCPFTNGTGCAAMDMCP